MRTVCSMAEEGDTSVAFLGHRSHVVLVCHRPLTNQRFLANVSGSRGHQIPSEAEVLHWPRSDTVMDKRKPTSWSVSMA